MHSLAFNLRELLDHETLRTIVSGRSVLLLVVSSGKYDSNSACSVPSYDRITAAINGSKIHEPQINEGQY